MKTLVAIFRWAAVWALAMSVTLTAAAQGTSADELLNDTGRVFQLFDSNQYADAWQNAAPFVKAKIPQDEFVRMTIEARKELGTVARRSWSSITRIQAVGLPGIPDGLYANVDFSSTLTSGRTVFEMLSFQLGDDGQWRLTGYRPRATQDTAPARAAAS